MDNKRGGREPLEIASSVQRCDLLRRFPSIRAIRSLTTNVRSDQAEERAGYSQSADEAAEHDGDEHVASRSRR